MKELTWDDSLSVQVDEIDEDHRRLIELFNILSRAVSEGESAAYLNALMEELLSCTLWHFRHEERLMLKHDYSGLDAHRQEHNELIDSARALQAKMHAAQQTVTADDVEFLERWLSGHILGADMEMGSYIGGLL